MFLHEWCNLLNQKHSKSDFWWLHRFRLSGSLGDEQMFLMILCHHWQFFITPDWIQKAIDWIYQVTTVTIKSNRNSLELEKICKKILSLHNTSLSYNLSLHTIHSSEYFKTFLNFSFLTNSIIAYGELTHLIYQELST